MKRHRSLLLLLTIIACLCGAAGAARAQSKPAKPLGKSQIIDLLKSEVASRRVAELVDERGIDFEPTAGDLRELREAGADEALIKSLRAAASKRQSSAPSIDALVRKHLADGTGLEQRGSFAEAEQKFRYAVALQEQNPELHYRLGKILARQRKQDDALAEYRQAIQLNTQYADAHAALGEVYAMRMDLDQAIPELRTAIALQPSVAGPHDLLAVTLYNQRNLEGALAEWREAARLEPDTAAGHVAQASLLQLEKRDPAEAIAEFR